MPTRREVILTRVETRLKTITTGGGYANTVKKVSRDLFPVDRLNDSEFPAIFIRGGPEALEYDTTETFRSQMTVRVEVWTQATKNLSMALNSLIGDVFKALRADPTLSLGGQAEVSDIFLAAVEDVDEVSLSQQGRAGALMAWIADYHVVLTTLD